MKQSPEVPPLDPADSTDRDRVVALAERFLPDGIRERWLALLRPAVRLFATMADQPWLARLGGLPSLPPDHPWPQWEGKGPLSYIGEIDCGQLSRFGLPLELPVQGRLLFFYFDGSFDAYANPVGYWDPSSAAGAQTLFVPDGATAEPRSAPDGLVAFGEVRLAGQSVVTAPDWEHPDLRAEFLAPGEDHRSFLDHPVCQDEFEEALYERHTSLGHQIGGYADPVKGSVEEEVARGVLGNISGDDEGLADEAARWELLLQVESDEDSDMTWGDAGTLYWLVRPEDLARQDLSQIRFVWQCA